MRMKLIAIVCSVFILATAAVASSWNPDVFQQQQTLEFYTINSAGEEHWSTVWTVAVDGVPYIRLGSASTLRINSNTAAPYLKIRIAGQEFDHVLAQSAPEMTDRVAAAMADKYWMDVLVRHAEHPLTMRLVPVPEPAAH
jgi:hypothetical protein